MTHNDHWPAFRLALILGAVAWLALYGVPGFSMSSAPPYPPAIEPQCDAPVPVNAQYDRVQCWFNGWPYTISTAPVSYVIPKTGLLRLVVQRHGYSATPVSCLNADGAQPGELFVKPCAVYYPDQRNYGTRPMLMNWGGPWAGVNHEGYLACAAIEYALTRWGLRVNTMTGFTLRGTSEGGTWAILQSIMMPCIWQQLITTVDATLPHTLFVADDGHYWRDPAVRKAWGSFDIAEADIATAFAAGKAKNIFYKIRGATNDSLGRVDLDFFRLCDQYGVRCAGSWDLGGHSNTGEPGIHLPRDWPRPDAVFTESSANNWGARGHYNAGLSAYRDDDGLHVRYQRVTNMGGGISDMPEAITVSVDGVPVSLISGVETLYGGETNE